MGDISEFPCILTVIPNPRRIFGRIDVIEFLFAYVTKFFVFCVLPLVSLPGVAFPFTQILQFLWHTFLSLQEAFS